MKIKLFVMLICTIILFSSCKVNTTPIDVEDTKSPSTATIIPQSDDDAYPSQIPEFILKAAGKTLEKDYRELTKGDIKKVTRLSLDKWSLESMGLIIDEEYDLSTVKEFPNLEVLYAPWIKIKNLDFLNSIGKLRVLGLSNIDDVEMQEIVGIPTIDGIFMIDCTITSLEPLVKMDSLKSLYLSNCKNIQDFAPLSVLKLNYLSISGMLDDESIKILHQLNNVTALDLKNNYIKHISKLPSMPCLQELSIDGNPLEEINLDSKSYPKLYLLSLRDTQLNDIIKIVGLDGFENISELDIMGSKIKYAAPLKKMGIKRRMILYARREEVMDLDELKGTDIEVHVTRL